jgi:hypothetical protein
MRVHDAYHEIMALGGAFGLARRASRAARALSHLGHQPLAPFALPLEVCPVNGRCGFPNPIIGGVVASLGSKGEFTAVQQLVRIVGFY